MIETTVGDHYESLIAELHHQIKLNPDPEFVKRITKGTNILWEMRYRARTRPKRRQAARRVMRRS